MTACTPGDWTVSTRVDGGCGERAPFLGLALKHLSAANSHDKPWTRDTRSGADSHLVVRDDGNTGEGV